MKKNFENMTFIANKVISQEVALGLLINSWLQLYPEITQTFIASLDHVLRTSPIPTPGARANLELLREQVARHQPTPAAGH